MMKCPRTGFNLGDPDRPPLQGIPCPSPRGVSKGLESFILSASGWRKVFASSGQEEDNSEEVDPLDLVLTGLAALTFASFLKRESGKTSPVITLGCDSRPTGPVLAETMIRVFLHRRCRVNYLFISAAPELMASNRLDEEAQGFAYISASHNPLGHNGFKFGLQDGGVLEGGQAGRLIEEFRRAAADSEAIGEVHRALSDPGEGSAQGVAQVFRQAGAEKEKARRRYADFCRRVVSQQEGPEGRERFFQKLKDKLQDHPLGIVAELNGSARTLSIDQEFLTSLGFRIKVVNGKPRQITHRIVPEGESLNLCREELEKARREDPAFVLGYVPDNDGDRGNLVYFDEATGSARILQAQEVFALAVLGELSFTRWMDRRGWSEETEKPLGVAVNGPTSLRIDAAARPFGAAVFRAEVGEANVVNRAREARDQGYRVPILGEGSNGGNITHPAAVRDPLNTLFALAKLLLLRDDTQGEGLFHLWCGISGRKELYREDFTLAGVLAGFPSYTSTSAYEPEAVMPIKTLDHAALKASFEAFFPASWAEKKNYLKQRWGIVSWRQINSEGTVLREGVGPQYRTGAQKGGLKIELIDGAGEIKGFLWMRGSGTEPVFRVAAEIEGRDPEGEKYLLGWLREMVEKC